MVSLDAVHTPQDIQALVSLTSSHIPTYPLDAYGLVTVTFHGDLLVACGGHQYQPHSKDVKECYSLQSGSEVWKKTHPLLEARSYAAAVRISETEVWVTGGIRNKGSSEIWTIDGQGRPYVTLPEDKAHHILVAVNETTILLVGGRERSDRIWLFDLRHHCWHVLARYPHDNAFQQAGVVTTMDGRRMLMTVGGKLHVTCSLDLSETSEPFKCYETR